MARTVDDIFLYTKETQEMAARLLEVYDDIRGTNYRYAQSKEGFEDEIGAYTVSHKTQIPLQIEDMPDSKRGDIQGDTKVLGLNGTEYSTQHKKDNKGPIIMSTETTRILARNKDNIDKAIDRYIDGFLPKDVGMSFSSREDALIVSMRSKNRAKEYLKKDNTSIQSSKAFEGYQVQTKPNKKGRWGKDGYFDRHFNRRVAEIAIYAESVHPSRGKSERKKFLQRHAEDIEAMEIDTKHPEAFQTVKEQRRFAEIVNGAIEMYWQDIEDINNMIGKDDILKDD